MRSKTLSCEKTIFLKEITRFWPLWGAYIAVLTLEVIGSVGLISDFSGRDPIYGVLNYLTGAPGMGVVAAFIASILTAMAVYSYMYTPKSISFAESLPVTRTSNFLTRFFAGLFWLFAVNIIVYGVFAIIVAISGMGCAGAVMGVLAMNLLFILFFYGFASFCAVLTGSIVVLPLVFIVLNFTAVAVETLCRSLLQMIVYGLTGMGMSFSFLSPSVELMRKCGAHLATATANPIYLWNYSYDEIPADLEVVFDGFGTAAIYAAAGIVFVILALLIYKKRHMENAGDVVAVRAAKPIFRYCMTFGCALVIGLLLYTVIFGGGYGAAAAAEVALCMVMGGFSG